MLSQTHRFCRIQQAIQSLDSPIVQPLAFFADAMLGRLTRWLRMLGYDTAYQKTISDESLTSHVLKEHRWLLTRDRYLVQRKVLRDRHTLLACNHLHGQLRSELHLELNLDDRTANRCAACNDILIIIPREKATSTFPAYVASSHPRFTLCPSCKQIYWPGTHWIQMLVRLQELRIS